MPELTNTPLRIFPGFDNFFHTINEVLSITQAWVCLSTFWIVSAFTWLTIRCGYFLRKHLFIIPASDSWSRLTKFRFVLLTVQCFLLTASQSYGQLIHSSIILAAVFLLFFVRHWHKLIITELSGAYVRFTLNQCALVTAIGYGPNVLMVCAIVLYQLLDLACDRGSKTYSIHSFRVSPYSQVVSIYSLLNQHPIAYFALVAGMSSLVIFVGSYSLWVNTELSVFVCSSVAVFLAALLGHDPMRQNVITQQGNQTIVLRTVTFTELIYACLLTSLHLLIGGVMYINTTLIVISCLLILVNVFVWTSSPFMYHTHSFGCDFGIKWKRRTAEDWIEYDYKEDEKSVGISDCILEHEWNDFVTNPSSITAKLFMDRVANIREGDISYFVWMARHDHRGGFICPYSHITMNGTNLTNLTSFADSSDIERNASNDNAIASLVPSMRD